MANPNPPPPPEEHRFGKDNQPANPGRTPTKWLRDLLSAAHDKGPNGRSHREAIGLHLIEVATSYEVIVKGRENPIELASAKDSIEAAKLLYSYDMGKPIESLEVTQNNGPRVLFYLPAKGSKTRPSAQVDDAKKDGGDATGGG